MSDDPFAVLGLTAAASEEEIRAARRRLAKRFHPDVAGNAGNEQGTSAQRSTGSMAAINAAAEAALAAIGRTATGAPPSGGRRRVPGHGGGHHAVEDRPSFTVEALPAEAFEALVVVSSWLGEVVDDDPPYVLEVAMSEPSRCWCRLELLPEAGASSVTLTVGGADGMRAPRLDDVRDVWISGLNALDWDDLDAGAGQRPW